MAKIKPAFELRNVKVMGLSVDSADDHKAWAKDIEETQGYALNYPIISDADFQVSKLYGMLPAETSGDPGCRTPADNQTVRNVLVIGPGQESQADPCLSHNYRAQLRRGPAGDRLTPAHREAQGSHAGELAPGRGRDHRGLRLRRGSLAEMSGGLGSAAALHPHRPAAPMTPGPSRSEPGQ
jgi:hypothetical protein